MNTPRTALALASAALLAAVGSPALAAPGAAAPSAASTATHCVLVLDEVKAGEQVSDVQSYSCFSGPGASARAAAAVPRAAQTELMTWSEHADWGGEYTKVYGSAGPCDAAGYSFNPNSYWSTHLSSLLVDGGCTKAFLSGPRGNGTFGRSIPYVGDTLNDAVTYIKIWRG
ncbi:hypothetical protein [Streptomyces sp. NBC_00582]|uniref:hypothetical protein n=1 Tax=Streptomyces sp. NBC_00582 TaxID=2975783 RepID=UPI00106456FE|nr:hypothetical protein [Streptomyces sp. NBC_00582]WUB66890.1 hypothetical protein OG852_44055 [Streptomyces sp. NBC_00582]